MRLACLLVGFAICAYPSFAQAADGSDFVVQPSEGYGIAECMKPGEECGQVIADAWCESHGHAHALAYGPTSDVTGSIAASATPVPPRGSILIHCGE